MKSILPLLLLVALGLTACVVEPPEVDPDVDCQPSSFIGIWEYQSTNGTVLDSIPDIEIKLSDDARRGDLMLNGRYTNIKTLSGCMLGEVSGLLDVRYELVSENTLHKRSTAFLLFGSITEYKRQ